MADAATTPSSSQRKPNSRPPSRPPTPLRRSSRGSLVVGSKPTDDAFPLNALEPAFAELSDAITTLEVNMGDMQIMHDSLSRFSESFASFLYGLNMNAFCVDFTEAPIRESFQRAAEHEATLARGSQYSGWRSDYDAETTFLTNDQSFVHEPAPPKNPTPTKTPVRRGARGGTRGGRGRTGTGIARGKGGIPRYK